ncbi:hypothetical protein P6166_12880 [Stenotrophomonas sp. HITSZ_GD]|uniref:hypothetical protein n=1 Tax=Stenotrophomonas sp. HITSZ_GD TaxID=3037248 RepID=UPI00240E1A83|nr:hypothetical protein [Stenotrophomonas sp. HITSZ_GD]MDG2526249.1 hypothetical protein [Stenotrophomonas sp. HITSZ_GD]
MLGISPLGWLHTLGSLPAIPLAAYMLLRHGRITPRTPAGRAYFWFMLIGASSVFLIAHQPVSVVIGAVTLAMLFLGYGAYRLPLSPRARGYVETIALSFSVFLLMLPTVSETLRRLPAGHPFVTDLKDPLLLGTQGGLLVALVVGLTCQIVWLRRRAAP